MYGPRQPSRVLNNSRFFLSLGLSDFMAAVAVFVIASRILDGTPYTLLAAVAPLALCALLIPLRFKYRRKIIRDALGFAIMNRKVRHGDFR